MLINGGAIFELKTVDEFNPKHQAQLLNYMILCEQNYGSLINFRTSSVKKWHGSTQIKHRTAVNCSWNYLNSCKISKEGARFLELFKSIIADLGAFLIVSLYAEIIANVWDGNCLVVQEVPILDKEKIVGFKRMYFLEQEVMFRITAFTEEIDQNRVHLQRLLDSTKSRQLYWINMNHQFISVEVLEAYKYK